MEARPAVMPAPLQAGVQFTDLQSDTAFQAAPSEEQIQYLMQDYLPKRDKDFAKASEADKVQYIKQVVLPKIKATAVPQFAPQQAAQPVQVQSNYNKFIGAPIAKADALLSGFTDPMANAASLGIGQMIVPQSQRDALMAKQEQRLGLKAGELNSLYHNPIANAAGDFAGMVVGAGPLEDAASMGIKALRKGADPNMITKMLSAGIGFSGYGGIRNTAEDIGQHGFNPMHNLQAGAQHLLPDFAMGAAFPPVMEKIAGPLLKAGVSATSKILPDWMKAIGRGKPPATIRGQRVTRKLPKAVEGEFGNNRLFKGTNAEREANFTAAQEKFIDKVVKEAQDLIAQGKRSEASLFITNATKGMDPSVRARIVDKLRAPKVSRVDYQQGSKEFEDIVNYAHHLRKAGKNREADLALGHLTPETKAKVYDEVKAREKADKQQAAKSKAEYEREYKKLAAEEKAAQLRQRQLEAEGRRLKTQKERQAVKDKLAEERESSRQRKAEMKRLQDDLKTRSKETLEEKKSQQQKQETDTLFGEAIQDVVNTVSKEKSTGTTVEHVAAGKSAEQRHYDDLVQLEKESQQRQRDLENDGRKTQNLKDKQAIKDRLALERAESKKRRMELKQLESDIRSRSDGEKSEGEKTQKTETKTTTETKPQKEKVKRQTKQEVQSRLTRAYREGHEVKIWYEAEGGQARVNEERIITEGTGRDGRVVAKQVGGESLESAFGEPRTVSIVEAPTSDASGNIIYKTTDETGIPKTRHVSHKSGSQTLKVEFTGEKAKFEYVENPATGKKQVRNIETGEFIEPGKSKGSAYTSTLKSDLSKMQSVLERVKRGESVTAEEIRDAAKPMTEEEFINKTKDLDDGSIDEMGKKVDC
jgi:hypothetical protein